MNDLTWAHVPPSPPGQLLACFRMRSMLLFYTLYLLCLSLGLLCVVCVSYWNSTWRGGFAWDGTRLQFNWHPVLMVAGLVVLYGNAAVLYRIPLTWGQNKKPWKLLHAGMMFLALLLSILGLCAVFSFHNANKTPNLYSLHSWLGICTSAMFAAQWVLGLAAFLLPCSPMAFRRLLKPVHVWMGSIIFSLSVAACISAHYNKRSTITSREIQTAVRLLLPGELAKHAVSEGTKAVTKVAPNVIAKCCEIIFRVSLNRLFAVLRVVVA
ncbi:hypothetical protein JZ751_001435 [Albula glossodonta]|uniref:Histone H2B n=1 Tax=Albula glossodonta TaxID=121402 RepID=A0A8T2PTE8_9TELE|nr:hypothetical protein JZ751_001435 [Albula glossodonta]